MSKNISTKESEVGILHDISLPTHKVYTIFTLAGHYRWGKSYSTDKEFLLLSGRCELTTESEWEDITIAVYPGEKIIIPAHTPNLFYFPVDTEMLEWFPMDATSKKIEKYYNIKNSNSI